MQPQLTQALLENSFHLQHHFGVSFGFFLAPFSLLLFLLAIYFLFAGKKEPAHVRDAKFEKKLAALEKKMPANEGFRNQH